MVDQVDPPFIDDLPLKSFPTYLGPHGCGRLRCRRWVDSLVEGSGLQHLQRRKSTRGMEVSIGKSLNYKYGLITYSWLVVESTPLENMSQLG